MALDDTSQAWLQAVLDGDTQEAERLKGVLETVTAVELTRGDNLPWAALDYAADGIAVFPIRPRGKTPLTVNGFKDASTDPATVASWWEQWPDANIGLPTGRQFDVIDIDGPDGARVWAKGNLDDFKPYLGHALTSREAGHHLYIPPQGRGNGAALAPGIDYRGLGGYVVAPPSVGANGQRYTWLWPLILETP